MGGGGLQGQNDVSGVPTMPLQRIEPQGLSIWERMLLPESAQSARQAALGTSEWSPERWKAAAQTWIPIAMSIGGGRGGAGELGGFGRLGMRIPTAGELPPEIPVSVPVKEVPISNRVGQAQVAEAVQRYDLEPYHAGLPELAKDISGIENVPSKLNTILKQYQKSPEEHGAAFEREARRQAVFGSQPPNIPGLPEQTDPYSINAIMRLLGGQ
jgi:hypothetical protein